MERVVSQWCYGEGEGCVVIVITTESLGVRGVAVAADKSGNTEESLDELRSVTLNCCWVSFP
jgi:hypothetical protein